MPSKSPPFAIRTNVVRRDDFDNRDWLRDQPVCHKLRQHHISRVEILEASVSPITNPSNIHESHLSTPPSWWEDLLGAVCKAGAQGFGDGEFVPWNISARM